MTEKNKIIAEINRRLDAQDPLGCTKEDIAVASAYYSLLNFIKSLQEQPVSEDLTAEIQYLHSIHPEVPLSELTRLAIHAMKCKEQQMVKDACEWLEDNLSEYCEGDYIEFFATHIGFIDILSQEELIRDFRKAMED